MTRLDPKMFLHCAAQPALEPEGSRVFVESTGEACLVRTYVTNVPGSRVYVGRNYKDTENTDGFLSFIPDLKSTPYRHPFDRDAVAYKRGYLQVTCPKLIADLDAVAARQNSMFRIATDFSYTDPASMVHMNE